MRKFILRVLFAGLFCFLAFIVCIATCFWMATHPPAFYAELMQQKFSAADQAQAEQRFEELVDSIELWARQSARLQHDSRQLQDNHSTPAFLKLLAAMAQPSVDDTRQIKIDQDDINAAFSSRRISGDQLRDVRVQLADDRIRLAGSLQIEKTTLYVSVDFQMNMEANGNLRVDLLTARLGKLPLPLGSVLRLFGDELNGDKNVQFDLEASPVTITFIPKQPKPDMFKLEQIVCQEGVLKLDLSAPTIAY